jgi:pimeloyl-ACP methyl ester carboxylesterase
MTGAAEPFRRVRFALSKGEMAGIAFGDPARPVDVLFLHATGLNARTYRTVLEPLGAHFHVLAVDLRGHGRSTLPASRFNYTSWRRHRDDVVALIEKHLRTSVTLAGHSMGATTGLLVAAHRPQLARGLALLDPVIAPPGFYAMAQWPLMPHVWRSTMPIAKNAGRRRADFPSFEAAQAALTGRGFFKTFPPDALADYVADGFVESDGGVTLACRPEWEQATFAAQRHDPWRALMRAPDPLIILRAEHGSTFRAEKRVVAMRPTARIAMVEGATHAFPLERPDRARAAIETAALSARGKGYSLVE